MELMLLTIIIESMFTYISFRLMLTNEDEQRNQWESGHREKKKKKLMKKSFPCCFASIKLSTQKLSDLFQLNSNTRKMLTVMSLIGNDNPKVNCLLGSELLIVPLLFHSNGSIRFNCHPGIIVTDFKCLSFRFLFELEDITTFGVTIWLGKFDALGWSYGACYASLLTAVLFLRCFNLWQFVSGIFHVDDYMLIVRV